MSDPDPTKLFPEFADVPGLDEARRRRRPFADLALSIARLRSSLGLTQAEFADRIGTTQSVISRLESGRHGIQISLLDRIAQAVGTRWQVVFAATEAVDASGAADAANVDDLLAAFNEANTERDFEAAHRHAARISKAANSPRRKLALGLDAFNHRRYERALTWARKALEGELPEPSSEVAHLVAGRSLLGLRRPAEAEVMLEGAGTSLNARAARAEVLLELDRVDEAKQASRELLAASDEGFQAAAEFLAARVAWHDNRPLDALVHIGAFRGREPGDRDGILLQGAILGHLGDINDDASAYGAAMVLFEEAEQETDSESVRLIGFTAGRLGRWRQALDAARRLRALSPAPGHDHRSDAATIAIGTLERLEEPADLDEAIAFATEHELVNQDVLRSYRAQTAAALGQFEEAVEALGLSPVDLHLATPADQVRCATAYLFDSRFADAYPILRRNVEALSVPDGQLFLARAALAVRDTTTARQAIRAVCDGDEPASEVARVALDLVTAIETSPRDALNRINVVLSEAQPARIVDPHWPLAGPKSAWEGPLRRGGAPAHEPASPVLDRFASAWATN